MIPKYRAYSKQYGMREVVGLYWFDDHLQVSLANGISTPIRTKDSQVKLMQSTGLADKNGVEIYEGDIVLVMSRTHAEVRYFNDLAGFGLVDCEIGYIGMLAQYDELKIIGNIYENKELLGGLQDG